MKRMTASYIINMIEREYSENQYLLNNSDSSQEKTTLMIKKQLLEEIINTIEEKQIELNGGINYK